MSSAPSVQNGKRLVSLINGAGKTCKIMKFNPCFMPQAKINSKSIKDLNINSKMVKLLKEHIWGKLFDFGLSNDILDITQV